MTLKERNGLWQRFLKETNDPAVDKYETWLETRIAELEKRNLLLGTIIQNHGNSPEIQIALVELQAKKFNAELEWRDRRIAELEKRLDAINAIAKAQGMILDVLKPKEEK